LAEHPPHALKPEIYCEIADSIDDAFGDVKTYGDLIAFG